jgi:hypothetical protein
MLNNIAKITLKKFNKIQLLFKINLKDYIRLNHKKNELKLNLVNNNSNSKKPILHKN